MAKKAKSVVNMSLLASINAGPVYVTKDDGVPLINHDPPLITVDVNDIDSNSNPRAYLTDAGRALLPNGHAAKQELAHSDTPLYQVISGVSLPEKVKRSRGGGGGAKTIYPWATMDVGGWFYVPVSDKHPDPAKSMASAVSSANMKYSEETGEMETVERTKRGADHKAIKDAAGNPVRETVQRSKRRQTRKFELWGKVEVGKDYNGWRAPADGVIVRRVA